MKVMVIGGCGYIGSATVNELCKKGYEVVVFDNLENGHLDSIPTLVPCIRGDLRRYDDILYAINSEAPNAIINFAGYAYVGESMKDPHKYYENNVCGAINLMKAIQHNSSVKKLVFSSSCATYGTPASLPITEDMPQNPENPYGDTKLTIEKMIKWYASTIPDFTYTLLRYFNAAGAIPLEGLGERHYPETHLIPLILQSVLDNGEIKVFGSDYNTPDGTCVRDYIHISDLAFAHILALDDNKSDYYNLGTGRGHSILDVIMMVEETIGCSVQIKWEPRRPGDPAELYASNEKAIVELGWIPFNSSLRNIIETAWEWHSECQNVLS